MYNTQTHSKTIKPVCLTLIAVGLMITLVPFAAGARRARPVSPEAEIRALLDRQVEAWNRKDLEAFMKGYHRAQELTFFSGSTKLSGWQATMDRYIRNYQSDGKEMGQLDFSDLQIEILGPKAAFVRGKWHLKMTAGDNGGLFTLIFKRLPDGWKIIHDHTSG